MRWILSHPSPCPPPPPSRPPKHPPPPPGILNSCWNVTIGNSFWFCSQTERLLPKPKQPAKRTPPLNRHSYPVNPVLSVHGLGRREEPGTIESTVEDEPGTLKARSVSSTRLRRERRTKMANLRQWADTLWNLGCFFHSFHSPLARGEENSVWYKLTNPDHCWLERRSWERCVCTQLGDLQGPGWFPPPPPPPPHQHPQPWPLIPTVNILHLLRK